MVHRSGLGKVRHVNVQFLWVQYHVQKKTLEIGKIEGRSNPADLMTKHLTKDVINHHLEAMSCELKLGRADSAPQLNE
eukprot:828765-Karenia_brevis.AAC.1